MFEKDQDEIYDVVIIGAGLSGLLAADILMKQEKKVLILQANRICGGMIKNYSIGETMKYVNKKIDWIQQSEEIKEAFIQVGVSEILTSHTYLMRLVEQYGLTLVPYYRDGKFSYFETQQKIRYVDSLMQLYFSEEYRKTMTKLLSKISNISKNIIEAHTKMRTNPSKKFYRDVLNEYYAKFDHMTVKQFLEQEIQNNNLRKLVINQFEIVESISVDKLSILQVFLHNYGLENFKLFTDKNQHFIEAIRIKEGISELVLKMQEKVKKRAKKLGITSPIIFKQKVVQIKNQINSEVQIITTNSIYKGYKVFYTSSIVTAQNVKFTKLSPAKRIIFKNQQFQPVQKIFMIFQTAFWRAKFSGAGVFSDQFPFSQINDVSPSNLSCGILCLVLCGKKPREWQQKFQKFENLNERYSEMQKYLKPLIAKAFLNGNQSHHNLKKMVILHASLKNNIGYQPYTKYGICDTLQKQSQDYLQCYQRDEHNIIFFGNELSKKFSSSMEGTIRNTRQKIYKFLQMPDPWEKTHYT